MGVQCIRCGEEGALYGFCWHCHGWRRRMGIDPIKPKEEDEQLERVNEIAEKDDVTEEDIEELTDRIEDEITKCETKIRREDEHFANWLNSK